VRDILFIAVAGALGALSRYGLSGVAQKINSIGFPIGTLFVNIIGSFLIGFVMQLGLSTDIIPRSIRVILTVGFLGAFTTFSTFSYETVKLLEDGAWILGIGNIAVNVIFGIIAVALGILLGRFMTGGI